MEKFETRFSQVEVLPMVMHYMNELDLTNIFEKYVPAESGSLTSHAESLCILTANIICDNKPLYKVQEWLSKFSDGFVEEPAAAGFFNDDRLARALSALFCADRHSLMSELSSNAISVHKLLTNEVHNDSTTVTFIGKYDSPDSEAVQLKHGHNKDFRPDCKQVVFGLNITANGHVPLSYKLFDGNTPDDVTHIPNWNALRSLLDKEDFIYVADCKLCSLENLGHISANGEFFITIVPKGRKEVKRFYQQLQEDDEERRNRRIEKAITKLEAMSPKLNAYHLKTVKEIKSAVDDICKGVKEFINVKIVTKREQVRIKISPGRLSLIKTNGSLRMSLSGN